jgi:chromosome segregation ATPase
MSNAARISQITTALREAAEQAEATATAVDAAASRAATRADDLRFQMSRLADQGNRWAEQMEGIIAHVQEGLIPADKAIHAFGDGLVLFDGQLRSVRDVLSDVLPTTGQVQQRIRDLIAELKESGAGIDELTARLAQSSNAYAKELAELVRLMKAGKITIEEVARRARELANQFPGSEGAALADLLAEQLREGQRSGAFG